MKNNKNWQKSIKDYKIALTCQAINCVQLSNATVFCENYANLYFDNYYNIINIIIISQTYFNRIHSKKNNYLTSYAFGM